MKVFAFLTCVWCVLLAVTDGEFRFASVFSDGMVLQQAPQRANVWGYGDTVGATVTVSIDGVEVATTTSIAKPGGGGGSKWIVMLPEHVSGGPYALDVSSSDGQLSMSEFWYGDVWFCSGQSNMEFNLDHMNNTEDTLALAMKYPNIHMLHILRELQHGDVEEVGITSLWQTASDNTATHEFSALCLLYAIELSAHLGDRPMGMVQTSWWGTPVESWSSPDALAACPPTNYDYGEYDHYAYEVLWFGMIEPLSEMTMYGAIWYQGESNWAHPDEYECAFPAMINDWRTKFNTASGGQTSDTFPFGFVQLAAYKDAESRTGFPDVRWASTGGYGYVPNADMTNVFMAVAMDLPDFDGPNGAIHPRNKQDVAKRLALAGRGVAYGETDLEFQGPFPSSITAGSGGLVVEYDNGNVLIDVRNSDGFELCCTGNCDNGGWQLVGIVDHDQTSVTVDSSPCANPTRVRYSWEETPCPFMKCPVYGLDSHLPAPAWVLSVPFS